MFHGGNGDSACPVGAASMLRHGSNDVDGRDCDSLLNGNEMMGEEEHEPLSSALLSHQQLSGENKMMGQRQGHGLQPIHSSMHLPQSVDEVRQMVMKNCANVLAVSTFVLLIIFIPAFALLAVKEGAREDRAAFFSAGAFVILTVPISIREIYLHLTHWYVPDVQKYVVRILWMVPLYSVQSWLSLRYHEFSLYIDTVRDLYEAFVIQSFLYYLVEILGGEETLANALRERGEAHHGRHGWLLEHIVPPWEMGREFMLHCKHGVLQYVVVKTFGSILAALLQLADLYEGGVFDLTRGYAYIAFSTNCAQMWALYCLVKLFYATKEDLRSPVDWKPIGKFCCVKGVVFFTWWQGLAINILQNYGIIDEIGTWDADDVATGLQDYLVCVEMLFFAIAHSYTFTYQEYCGGDYQADDVGGAGGAVDAENDDAAYRPPVIRKLSAPMNFSHAFWSSTLPTETLSDIARLRGGASVVANDPTVDGISLCVKNAESI